MASRIRSQRRAETQVIREVDAQSMCEKLLARDSRILYSSYLDSDGQRVGEATRSLIGIYDELTIVMLPLLPGKGELVLAVPVESDLIEIVGKAKSLISES